MSEKTPVVLDKMMEQQVMGQNTDFDYKLFKSDSIRVVADKIVFKKIEVKIRLESAFVYQIMETTPIQVQWVSDEAQQVYEELYGISQPSLLDPETHSAKFYDIMQMETTIKYDIALKQIYSKMSKVILQLPNLKSEAENNGANNRIIGSCEFDVGKWARKS